jgi:hypothetical protein
MCEHNIIFQMILLEKKLFYYIIYNIQHHKVMVKCLSGKDLCYNLILNNDLQTWVIKA